TANEVNVKSFDIERSFNGADFTTVSTKAANNRSTQLSYSYIDADPIALKAQEKLYYRLKMIDADGKYSYSNVVVINPFVSKTGLSVYPNPVKGSTLYIKLDKQAQPTIKVKIEDISGRLWKTYTFNSNNYTNQGIPINVQQLPP